MTMKTATLALTALLMASSLHAQLKKTLHKTFEVPEQTETLLLNIFEKDSYDVVPWAGNAIMVETNIKVYYTSRSVFDFLLEEGRYNFVAEQRADSLLLSGEDMQRQIVKLGDTESLEKVHSRIFIPDAFEQQSAGVWARELEEEEKSGNKLDRESIDVSENLKERLRSEQDSTAQPPERKKEDG